MHSRHYKIGEYDVAVHKNGDWSGEAIVTWRDRSKREINKVKIPAMLLVAIGIKEADEKLRSDLINFVEQYPKAKGK